MAEHKKRSQLVGDFVREVAVLWAALYPLEAYINHSFRWKYCAETYAAVVVLMVFGVTLEGRNPNERPSAETSRFRLLSDRVRGWFVFSKAGTKARPATGAAETTGTKPMDE